MSSPLPNKQEECKATNSETLSNKSNSQQKCRNAAKFRNKRSENKPSIDDVATVLFPSDQQQQQGYNQEQNDGSSGLKITIAYKNEKRKVEINSELPIQDNLIEQTDEDLDNKIKKRPKRQRKNNKDKQRKNSDICETSNVKETEKTLAAAATGNIMEGKNDHSITQEKTNEIQVKSISESKNQRKIKPETSSMTSTSTTQKRAAHPSPANTKDLELGLKQAEERLQKDYIFPLIKPSTAFPDAKYFCRVCSHHLNTITTAHHHIKDKRHKREWKLKQQDELLKQLVEPPSNAMEFISQYLQTVLDRHVIMPQDITARKDIVTRLNALIQTEIPGCDAALFGSSLSGFGFKRSDVNIDIAIETDMKAPKVLISMLKLLTDSEHYTNVQEDFEAKFPRIEFIDRKTKLSCKLSAGNHAAVKTSQLIALYAQINPLVLKVGMLFRIWANLCRLDKQTEGTLPSHAYSLMAVAYMQNIHQIPVLHEKVAEHDLDEILTNNLASNLLSCKGSEWQYQPTPNPVDQSKKKAPTEYLDDDSDCDEAPPRSSKSYNSPTYTHQLKPISIHNMRHIASLSLASAWLSLLKYYAAEFDVENMVITVMTSLRVTRSERGWAHKRIAVEDPYSGKWNLCKPMTSQSIFSHFMGRLKFAVTYFYTQHTKKMPHGKTDEIVQNVLYEIVDQVCQDGKNNVSNNRYRHLYKFTEPVLTGGIYPVTMCCLCRKEGHTKRTCPEDINSRKLKPLPPFSNQLEQMLTGLCNNIFNRYNPQPSEVAQREFVCNKLLLYLKRVFSENVDIQLFGSSRNGFTFRGSDLDICMTFVNDKTGKDVNFVEVIENLARILRKNNDLSQIVPITTAKVPIVKFIHRQTNLEGDISLYNLLAQENTHMLRLYSEIDRRCRVLGYMMKAFVKLCCIGDASRGSLSSYAYTLFVIYFLQQRNPPVLPVLQELHPFDQNKPVKKVDGWNAWFYNDMKHLHKVWPEYSKNKESIGRLWYEMIRFYTETFDFKRQVICIRQKEILTTFEKEWTSKYISIEDPFDLSHNLGAGVSRKMTNFIMRVLHKAREHFGVAPRRHNIDPIEYFLDASLLMDGQQVPNDRCCRVCGKIGHFVKDCPRRRGNRKNGDEGMTCFYCNKKGHMKRECPEIQLNNKNDEYQNGMIKPDSPLMQKLESAMRNLTPPSHVMERMNRGPRRHRSESETNNQNGGKIKEYRPQNPHEHRQDNRPSTTGKMANQVKPRQLQFNGVRTPNRFITGVKTLEEIENQMISEQASYHGNKHGVSEWILATPPRSTHMRGYHHGNNFLNYPDQSRMHTTGPISPRGSNSSPALAEPTYMPNLGPIPMTSNSHTYPMVNHGNNTVPIPNGYTFPLGNQGFKHSNKSKQISSQTFENKSHK